MSKEQRCLKQYVAEYIRAHVAVLPDERRLCCGSFRALLQSG